MTSLHRMTIDGKPATVAFLRANQVVESSRADSAIASFDDGSVAHYTVRAPRGLGGPGSGNFGHAGRPGTVGGSAPSAGIMAAIQQADGGFTYHAVTGQAPTTGFAVSLHKDRERVLNAKDATVDTLARYAADNWDLLTETNNYFGGWHNPDDDKVYLDVSTVFDSVEEALRKGADANQLAIFDLAKGQSIPIQKRAAHVQAYLAPHRATRWATHVGRSHRHGQATHRTGTDGGGVEEGEADSPRALGGPGSGNFGHAGRPGQIGGSGRGSTSAFDQALSLASVQADLTQAVGHELVRIENSPVAKHAAHITANTLAEMKVKGYVMPDQVVIGRTSEVIAPEGHTVTDVGKGEPRKTLKILFPINVPSDADANDVVRVAFSENRTTVNDVRGIVLHEMAHVQHNRREYGFEGARNHYTNRWFDSNKGHMEAVTNTDARIERAVRSVSQYAYKNPGEFVAEAFVRKYRGETLTPDAQLLYDFYQGPKIR